MYFLLFGQFALLLITQLYNNNINEDIDDDINEDINKDINEDINQIPYEDKYKEKLKNMVISNHNKQLDQLKNSFVMESTPNGNVLMFWDNQRSSFIYYSDTSIPYRYLEVVARKYVILNNCREIYYVMEEQLKPLVKEIKPTSEHNNVFAKLKNYNQSSIIKPNSSSKKSSLPFPLPRIQVNKIKDNNESKEILLKENSNRYSYAGKMVNFSFLKQNKINNYENISFSDFKNKFINK